tara:strand:- start:300 stop:593 length:294 start_codon:yes stop_codon:yes gene_type:complete
MKIQHFAKIIGFAALGIALSAQAHDPKEHMKDAEDPNCAAMKNMDHSKMDMNDPVMQAMMKQCTKDKHHNESEKDDAQADHEANEENSGEQHSEHQR